MPLHDAPQGSCHLIGTVQILGLRLNIASRRSPDIGISIQDKEEILNPGGFLEHFSNAPPLPMKRNEGNTPYFDPGPQPYPNRNNNMVV